METSYHNGLRVLLGISISISIGSLQGSTSLLTRINGGTDLAFRTTLHKTTGLYIVEDETKRKTSKNGNVRPADTWVWSVSVIILLEATSWGGC